MNRRTLLLVRHAKAEPFGHSDHSRRLTARGREDAAAAGEYLRAHAVVPDHVVVSTADRARDTWLAVEETLGSGARPVEDGAVYSGGTDAVLEALRVVPPDAEVVAFVGHQPTVGDLAHLLDDGMADHAALHRMLHGFPSCSVAVFEIAGEWADLGPETGRLVDFRTGRP